MHNFAFSKLGLNFAYLPFEVKPDQLGNAIQSISSLNLVGVNITKPHKQTAFKILGDRNEFIDPYAKLLNAINTIVIRKGRLEGYNTDGPGFLNALEDVGGISLKGKNAVVVGSGGTARAIASVLIFKKVKTLTLLARNLAKAYVLEEDLSKLIKSSTFKSEEFSVSQLPSVLKHADIICNTIPSGWSPSLIKAASSSINKNAIAFDAVYSEPSKFLEAARSRGAITINGKEMLIHQGALSFQLWTGEKPPVELMRKALAAKQK